MSLRTLDFRHIHVVENLHSTIADDRAQLGFGLVEALVALTVLAVAAAGVVAVGGASRRLAELAAVRATQLVAARAALDAVDGHRPWPAAGAVPVGKRLLQVKVDSTRIARDLIELTIAVGASGPAGPYEVVTRRQE